VLRPRLVTVKDSPGAVRRDGAVRRVDDGLARAERQREHAQRVTAPSAALETSLAYLASTPVPDSPLSGAS
jgi:hypothetical protein